MAKWNTRSIKEHALAELQRSPKGIRYGELVKKISAATPETPPNTIVGSLQGLSQENSEIVRPSRGLWILKKYVEKEAGDTPLVEESKDPIAETTTRFAEEKTYEPFARWLVAEEQVIEALVIGGKIFKDKWATPDVIGTYKERKSDLIPFPLEIISAEIKVDGAQSITAFGQACAYRLFSHKTYIVMPNTINNNDFDRLDALCTLYGIGLVLFVQKSTGVEFEMRLKAQRLEPDVFYMNEFARRLLEVNRADFDRLFG
jgi:hypothetical protein